MSIDKKINTMLLQLDMFASGNRQAEEAAARVRAEWAMERDSTNIINNSDRAELNRVLHSTRAFDTGLRLFLDKFNHTSQGSHSIGSYIDDLQRNVTPASGFKQLNGNIPPRIQTEVTDKRNKYMHSAGNFPTKAEADFIVSSILKYYVLILGLANN